jgi:hypothetical protein
VSGRRLSALLGAVALLAVVVLAGAAIGGPPPRTERASGDPDAAVEKPTPGEADRSGDATPAAERVAQDAYPKGYVEASRARSGERAFDALPADSALSASWVGVGPDAITKPPSQNYPSPNLQAGRVTSLAVAPICQPGDCRVWMAAAGGGVWRTNDGLAVPVQWEPTSNGIESQAIGSLAVDPNDASGNTIYAGTGEPNGSGDSEIGTGLFRSTDGGTSWQRVAASVPFSRDRSIGAIAIKPGDPRTIWFGTSRGRHGWSATAGENDYTPPNAPPLGVYVSNDGGSTFRASLLKDPSAGAPADRADGIKAGVNHLEIDPGNPDTVYAALFGYGIWRSSAALDGDAGWRKVYAAAGASDSGRVEFALVRAGSPSHTRIYAGDGSQNPGGKVFRADNADVPALSLVTAGGANTAAWQALSSANSASPGFASNNYCDGQCDYDNVLTADPAHPDTVWIGGVTFYDDVGFSAPGTANRSNGRAVMRSTDAGATFRDATNGRDDALYNGSHPDLHAIALSHTNPGVAFVGSDGGVVRTDGNYVDGSPVCSSPTRSGGQPLSPANKALCQQWLSSIPQRVVGMNHGLKTLQFQAVRASPADPSRELIGGTQDNGSMKTSGDPVWTGVSQGDGGAAGFDLGNATVRLHGIINADVEVSFQNGNDGTWLDIAAPLRAAKTAGDEVFFYPPTISDPRVSGTVFFGMDRVWRTPDNGGQRAVLEANCAGNTPPGFTCGDWVPLGGSKLTGNAYGTDRTGSALSGLARAPSDDGTLWATTGAGRIFVSKNADAAANLVTFKRIDGDGPLPNRFPSGIAVDPGNSDRAWVSFSGYNAYTPQTSGHVFKVTYDPAAQKATWTDVSYDLGDEVVRDVAFDPHTGDLYAASDFGVARLPAGSTHWADAAAGLPPTGIADLEIAPESRLLYAATHGRSAYRLALPSAPSPTPPGPGPDGGGGRSGSSSGGAGGGAVPGAVPAARPLGVDVLRRNRRIRVGRGGVFRFVLGPQDVDAVGRIGFNARVPGKAAAARARRVVLSSKTLVSTAGQRTAIPVRLSSAQLRVVRATRRLGVTAKIAVHDRAGHAARRNFHFVLLPLRR